MENDCNKNKSFEEILEYDLTKANFNAYNEVAIPSASKNWQPPQPASNFKPYKPKFEAPSWERVDNPEKWCQYTYQPKYSKNNIWSISLQVVQL